MNDDPEPDEGLDPERYDRWLEQPLGRHAFAVGAFQIAVLDLPTSAR